MKKPYIQLIGATIVLLAVIGVYASWYMAVQAKIVETSTLSQEISQQTVASSRVQEAKTELKTLNSDQDTLNQYFLSTDNVVPFLEHLQAIGTYLGSDTEVVSVSATPGTPVGELDLSLKVSGSFNAVMKTLGAIEYSPYDITLTSLTFDAEPSSGATVSATQWTAAATYTIGTITGVQTTVPPAEVATSSVNSTVSSTPSATTTTVQLSPIRAS